MVESQHGTGAERFLAKHTSCSDTLFQLQGSDRASQPVYTMGPINIPGDTPQMRSVTRGKRHVARIKHQSALPPQGLDSLCVAGFDLADCCGSVDACSPGIYFS